MAIVHEDTHNYASNGKANAALTTGIIGTSGFGLTLLNALTGGGGLLGAGKPPVCNEDHFVNRYEAAQSAKIAELETEIKFRDSSIYTDGKLLDMYKYFEGENREIKSDIAEMKAQQGVINANLMTGLDVLKAQAADTRAIVNGITRTAVPQSVICSFATPCGTCSGSNI
jgi:hypothetical protein